MRKIRPELTAIESRALGLLSKRPMNCTELGEALWSTGRVNRQSYARPAGKIIQRLVRAGLVRRVFPDGWLKRSALYQAATIKEATP
jgi:hypothetical protein